jgi:hypothetical protein
MEEICYKALDQLVEFTKEDLPSIEDGTRRILASGVGIRLEYEHDANQLQKAIDEKIASMLPKGIVFWLVINRIDENDDLYAVVLCIYKKEDYDLFKPYFSLKYFEMCPMELTGIMDPKNKENMLVRAIHRNLFDIGTGITKDQFRCMKIHWRRDGNMLDDIVKEISEMAEEYGLKIHSRIFHKRAYTKIYIYQTMSPELEAIIKRDEFMRVV